MAFTGLGYDVTAMDELKTAPRGCSQDHPRVALLRMQGCVAVENFGAPKWIHTRSTAKRIRDTWTATRPLTDGLDTHVGPSTLPPDDRPF